MPERTPKGLLIGLVGLGLAVGLAVLNSVSHSDLGDKQIAAKGTNHPQSPTSPILPSVVKPRAEVTNTWTLLPAAELLEEFHSLDSSPEDDLAVLDALLIAYRQVLKENPSGENYEIIEALTGKNRASVAVIPPDHTSLSPSGELLDRWGRPYHFHSISSQRMDIRSAGPDGQLWSDDDGRMEEFE